MLRLFRPTAVAPACVMRRALPVATPTTFCSTRQQQTAAAAASQARAIQIAIAAALRSQKASQSNTTTSLGSGSPAAINTGNMALPPQPPSSSSSTSDASSSTTTGAAHQASSFRIVNTTRDPALRQSYKEAVEKRVIGNAALRKLIKNLHHSQYLHAVEAVEGAKQGGLVIDSDTCDAYLALLIQACQLKQAMEVYHYMLRNKVCPNTRSFNQMMDLCLEKQSWEAALTLFSEMQRRGRQPDVESYERALTALSLQTPAQWEKAVMVFDKLQRNKAALSSHTYNALMKVYLKMEPFEWTVVYNAYHEMRKQKPTIQFGWNSYDLVAEALRKGRAGPFRRLLTYIDAWVQITPPFSLAAVKGLMFFVTVVVGGRVGLLVLGKKIKDAWYDQHSESTSDPIL